jgi:aspartate dehydrogenase
MNAVSLTRRRKEMRVGLIGCGAIGRYIALAISKKKVQEVELVGIADSVNNESIQRTVEAIECPFTTDVHQLIDWKPDLVVEAASQAAVRDYSAPILEAGVDLLVISVGALADPDLLAQLTDLSRRHGRRLYVPSGAIGGIDIIKGAMIGGLDECRLTTTKPPKALSGIPYVEEKGIDLENLDEPTVLYEGPAASAVRLFPQNVNVAAAISLAGIGADRTMVRIVADPEVTQNKHEVFLRGAFGEASVRILNNPNPLNPKSSYLASLSAIATLQRIAQNFQLGS